MEESLTLKVYFKDLKTIQVLSGEKQVELAIKAKMGDQRAFEELVKSNLKFVITVAKEYLYSKMPLEDLIGEGNLGLMKAVEKFDPNKDIKFLSYAVWWIRQSIIQSIYENGNIVRLPINRINLHSKLNRAKEILYKQLNREPTIRELGDFCDVAEKDVLKSLSNYANPIELEQPRCDDANESFSDYLEGDEFENMERCTNRNAASHEICSALDDLSRRESKILKMYFGLDDGKEMNLREIGEKLDLTNERVRQIKDFALKKLRTYGKSHKLRSFLNCEL